jgi:hypothetical protein
MITFVSRRRSQSSIDNLSLLIYSSFHVSHTVSQDPGHPLYRQIDWAEVESGMYAVVDPDNKNEILYLSRTQYIKLLAVYRSTEGRVHLLAAPKSKPQEPTHELPNSPPEANMNIRGFLPSLVQGIGLWCLYNGNSTTVLLTEDNCSRVIQRYGKLLYFWATGKVPPRSVQEGLWKFACRMTMILRTQGYLALTKRLKNNAICIGHYLSGNPMSDRWLLGTPIGISNGLPKDLPSVFRHQIRNRDVRYLRFIFSLLFLYKGTSGKEGKIDLSSITDSYEGGPDFDFETVLCPARDVLTRWFGREDPKTLVEKLKEENYVRYLMIIQEVLGNAPTNIEIDIDAMLTQLAEKDAQRKLGEPSLLEPTPGLVRPEHMLWPTDDPGGARTGENDEFFPYLPTQSAGPNASNGSLGILPDYYQFTKVIGMDKALPLMHRSPRLKGHLEFIKKYIDDLPDDVRRDVVYLAKVRLSSRTGKREKLLPDGSLEPRLGKLSVRVEPAGKMRVFAIVDQITQWILQPLHEYLFKILKSLPTDCTFDHQKGVRRLQRLPGTYRLSLDLKSATDRIPIGIYMYILTEVFGREYAEAWRAVLVDRTFHWKDRRLKYSTGQPMGAYSSWALLAIAHHYLVMVAAKRAGKDTSFDLYQVLGDDIVIADFEVGVEYKRLLNILHIPFSVPKSFESDCGFFEFASNIVLGEHNLSPVSLKEVLGAVSIDKRLMLAQRTLTRWYPEVESNASVITPLKLMINHYQFKDLVGELRIGKVRSVLIGLLASYLLAPGSFFVNMKERSLRNSPTFNEEALKEFKVRSLKQWCALLAWNAFPVTDSDAKPILGSYFLALEGPLYDLLQSGLLRLLRDIKTQIYQYWDMCSRQKIVHMLPEMWTQKWIDESVRFILEFWNTRLSSAIASKESSFEDAKVVNDLLDNLVTRLPSDLSLGYDYVVWAFDKLMLYTEPLDWRYKSSYRRNKSFREALVINLIKASLFRQAFIGKIPGGTRPPVKVIPTGQKQKDRSKAKHCKQVFPKTPRNGVGSIKRKKGSRKGTRASSLGIA